MYNRICVDVDDSARFYSLVSSDFYHFIDLATHSIRLLM